MSDRRSHEERNAAIAQVVRDMNEIEAGDVLSPNLLATLRLALEAQGFGEAWARDVIEDTRWATTVVLRVENTEVPEFILRRTRYNSLTNQEFAWSAYTWVPGT